MCAILEAADKHDDLYCFVIVNTARTLALSTLACVQ